MKLTILALGLSLTSFVALAANPLNDAQITKVVMTIDKGEADLGKLAKDTSKNKDVLSFADHMISDHSKGQKKAEELSKKLSWTPQESEKSLTMKSDGEKTKAELMSKKDPSAFDVAYIDAMVLGHQKVLKGIDEELLPAAKNSELKAMLKTKRDTVAMHLKHAQELQAKL